ncbi:AraC family transcriptional regulator [uncultured Butyricimonas sp.]|uniref:helix-turn-helix domain-containing protein n=1 Tax=uncultured Butyricimonas sp. TaxID=1268785 RepID=UPI0026DC928A|nr:helix-turn-helix domain-containing protein [uncultured Butyricimonas sp.]
MDWMTNEDLLIIIVNSGCITLLVVMAIVLGAATRMKSGGGFAVLIVATTVPVYIYNLSRSVEFYGVAEIAVYPACFMNALLLPVLWLFVRGQLDKTFKFTAGYWWHFIPACISLLAMLIYYLPMSREEFIEDMLEQANGVENFVALVNDFIVLFQLVFYFILIFRFLRRVKRALQDNYSDSDYLTIGWLPRTVTLFGILFVIVFVTYLISPRTDVWLIPILNVIAMSYLTYNYIVYPVAGYICRLDSSVSEVKRASKTLWQTVDLDIGQMKLNCARVIDILNSTHIYRNPDLSLDMLSRETGIGKGAISRSINGYLQKNFFELINEMRVREAKRMLLLLKSNNYTIDSIYRECGFHSRSTFFLAFKKVEGTSPARWLNEKEKY